MRYQLRSLSIDGFKSFRKHQVIEFDGTGGLKFLTGRNEVEPRLGANGAGKTSMWDALFWCLYGTSVLGDKASDLTSWGVKRACVEATFDCDGEAFGIIRTGSPERLSINGKAAAQSDIDGLMGLSKARFAQSVVFGQKVEFFLDLTIPQRGLLLDEALDLSVWIRAAAVASNRLDAKKTEIIALQRTLAFDEGRLSSLPDIRDTQDQAEQWQAERDAEVEALLVALDEADARAKVERKKREEMLAEYDRLPKPDTSRLDELRKESAELSEKIAGRRGEITGMRAQTKIFADGVAVCPTCHQAIDPEMAKAELHQVECSNIDIGIDIDEMADKLAKLRPQIETAERTIARQSRARTDLREAGQAQATRLEIAEGTADRLAREAEEAVAEDRVNPFLAKIETLRDQAKEISDKIEAGRGMIFICEGDALKLDHWKNGFKSVRLWIVERMLLQLEIETANAASLLGLSDWKIKFATETENKSGGVKQGVQVKVQSPEAPGNWAVWSGGEGQRIRLAVEMGLAGLIQRMAGVSYDFEVWDEPSGFLSDEGIDDLLECLRYRAQMTKKAIWLTDHRTYAYNFAEVWTAVKGPKGTVIEQSKMEQ